MHFLSAFSICQFSQIRIDCQGFPYLACKLPPALWEGAGSAIRVVLEKSRRLGLWAAPAGFSNLIGAGTVGLKFGHFAEAFGETFQQLAVERRFGGCERIVAPKPRLSGYDQISLA